MDRLPLTDAICIDEVYLDMDEYCKVSYIRQLLKKFRQRDRELEDQLSYEQQKTVSLPPSDEVYLLQKYRWLILASQTNIKYHSEPRMDSHFHCLMNTFDYEDYIINSFIMVEKHGAGKVYNSRLSNGPIESINRKVKDLKRLGRGFRNFVHFHNRFLYATRQNPVLYFEDDDT